MTKKLGRNDPCHCGSGRKYKKCCLAKDTAPTPRVPGPEDLGRIQEAFRKHQLQIREWKERFGEVKPIIHADLAGKKLVAIGNTIAYSDKWTTFTDFLIDYPKLLLGGEWGKPELAKPREQRHQILKWLVDACEYANSIEPDDTGGRTAVLSGPMAAYLNLAYDLYALRHHGLLQEEVVARLKHPDQFQGARHELFVAATFIRAGFDIEYADETDPSQRHPEFYATHRKTGQKIAVEAKSKHRKGVLGYTDGVDPAEDERARVRNLLKKAFSKGIDDLPYVVFLDVNLPPDERELFKKEWVREVAETIDPAGGKTEDGHDRFNLIVATNHPEHYGDPHEPTPVKNTIAVFANQPLVPLRHPQHLFEIHDAAEQYGNVPNEFPNKDDRI